MSKSNDWETPLELYRNLNTEFGFTLDPCCTKENAKCTKHFTSTENGLLQDWGKNIVFMNPPYGGEIYSWMKKAYESFLNGAVVVCLVPSRTDTKWWHEFAMRGKIRFLKGRLKFSNSKNSAPFPSAIVVFR